MAIKNIIYKAAKKISTTNQLDITPEELAHLALYKVMNLPYFEGANNFLTLHYNVFNEISLGHAALTALKGYTNGNHASFVIIMDKKDHVDSEVNAANKILKQSDTELLKIFLNIINNSTSIEEISRKISKIEDTDPVFLNKILAITETGDHYGNPLMRGLMNSTKYKGQGTYAEHMLETQTKVQYYRSVRSLRDLKEITFDSYDMKSLTDKSIKDIVESISDHTLESFTGVKGINKDNLKNFHKSHPEEYSKSLYKIFKENEKEETRINLAFNLLKLKEGLRNINKKSQKILSNKTAEELLNKYENQISSILKIVEKKYPQIKAKSVDETDYEIKTFIYNTENEKDHFIDREVPLEIYQDEYTSTNYTSIRGNSFYKDFYRTHSGIYIAADNGLEDIIGGEGYFRSELRTGGYSISLENVRLNRIYESGRDVNVAIKRDVIEAYVKMAQEKNVPFVHDILERNHGGEAKFNNDMYTITNELKEKYPDVIFVNDGFSMNDGDRLKTDIKAELLMTMTNNDYSYSKMITANKKIEDFFKTDTFQKIINMDYFERKNNGIVDKKIESILNELNKNKMKVSP